LTPAGIAALYRELRKGREDKGDSAGAGDLYYGEMEMRRHDADAPMSERVILWLYWAISGYGLRGARALVSTIVAFAFLFRAWGFSPHPTLTRSLLFSAESASALFKAPLAPGLTLTSTGEIFLLALRLLGPLFLGLAFLALRARVRR
jgi:hypothetical protein